jgi:6-phosphogluconolactonase
MDLFDDLHHSIEWDSRRKIIVPGDFEKTIHFAVQHFIQLAQEAIKDRGAFFVALSGGSTPNAIFKQLLDYRDALDWSKVYLFWSDERAVPPDHAESNYCAAMKSGLAQLPLDHKYVFRMKVEPPLDIEKSASEYEKTIFQYILNGKFDLVMLGMGEDGHTASLFPYTAALHADAQKWVVANYIPSKKCWRMTFTFKAINSARKSVVYVLGVNKAEMVQKIFKEDFNPEQLPIQGVGSDGHCALWILDVGAARDLFSMDELDS